jgi:hypothetical protein
MEFEMKRIVDGCTYNTETSRLLAKYEFSDDDNVEHTVGLYQTRGGAFYELDNWIQERWIERERRSEQRERSELTPKSADEAQRWIVENDVEVTDNPFDDPPEAAQEQEPGSTVYVRVPPSLKRAIDQAALRGKLSVTVSIEGGKSSSKVQQPQPGWPRWG